TGGWCASGRFVFEGVRRGDEFCGGGCGTRGRAAGRRCGGGRGCGRGRCYLLDRRARGRGGWCCCGARYCWLRLRDARLRGARLRGACLRGVGKQETFGIVGGCVRRGRLGLAEEIDVGVVLCGGLVATSWA